MQRMRRTENKRKSVQFGLSIDKWEENGVFALNGSIDVAVDVIVVVVLVSLRHDRSRTQVFTVKLLRYVVRDDEIEN